MIAGVVRQSTATVPQDAHLALQTSTAAADDVVVADGGGGAAAAGMNVDGAASALPLVQR